MTFCVTDAYVQMFTAWPPVGVTYWFDGRRWQRRWRRLPDPQKVAGP